MFIIWFFPASIKMRNGWKLPLEFLTLVALGPAILAYGNIYSKSKLPAFSSCHVSYGGRNPHIGQLKPHIGFSGFSKSAVSYSSLATSCLKSSKKSNIAKHEMNKNKKTLVSSDEMRKLTDDELTMQFLYNKEKHLSECLAMEKAMDIDYTGVSSIRSFEKSDIISTSFNDTLLGEPMNHPFETTELIHVSRAPLFTPEECEAIILEAEQHALSAGGWQTARHYSHRTTDVPLSALPAASAWLRRALPATLLPMVAACFPQTVPDPRALRAFDLFVVKYDAGPGGQTALRVHRDSSLVSFTVALNPRADFAGGGMWVETLDKVRRPPPRASSFSLSGWRPPLAPRHFLSLGGDLPSRLVIFSLWVFTLDKVLLAPPHAAPHPSLGPLLLPSPLPVFRSLLPRAAL